MGLSFAGSPEFQRLLRDEPDLNLVRIALEIAGDAYPGLDLDAYEARIEALADRARERCSSPSDPRRRLGQINWVLYCEEGFRGNEGEFYDPRNSYLNDVLDRKTGIPISLSLIYWRIAERLGFSVSGMNLPAHFMLRVGSDDSAIYVDPFHEGAMHTLDGCRRLISAKVGGPVVLGDDQLSPCSVAVVVGRMLRNLKSIHLQSHDYPAAVAVQRRLVALHGENGDELRDLGMLFLHLDRPAQALPYLESSLKLSPSDPDSDDLRALIRAARRDMAMRN